MAPEQETKEKIMETAFELFGSKGYDKVSINEIAETSGISKGGIFHYFDSKYALGRDSLMWWAQTHMGPMFETPSMLEMTDKEMLIHFIDFMVDFLQGDTSFTRFFWSVFDESIRRKEDINIWLEFLNDYVSLVEDIYKRMGVKDPKMKAMLLLSNMDGMALYQSMLNETGEGLPLEKLKEEFIRTYVTFEEEARI